MVQNVIGPVVLLLAGATATSLAGCWARAAVRGLLRRRLVSALCFGTIAVAAPALMLIGAGMLYTSADGHPAGRFAAALALAAGIALTIWLARERSRRERARSAVPAGRSVR